MAMPPRLRRIVLTAHITSSVGWLGAIVAYLALDVIAATSQDTQTVRAAMRSMEVIVRYAIVPLALASVAIGILNALGTRWGLFRHYWVLLKLVLTAVATVVLLREVGTVTGLAAEAAAASDPRGLPGTLPHSVGALVVLLSTVVLSVFKPRGLTRYGWRKARKAAAG